MFSLQSDSAISSYVSVVVILATCGAGCSLGQNEIGNTNSAQGQATSLKLRLGIVHQDAVLESFSDRRGHWMPDGKIGFGEWISVLSQPDSDGYYLAKPRAEFDIIRRVHSSRVLVDEPTYEIEQTTQTGEHLGCPLHLLNGQITTSSAGLGLLPPDIALSYRWAFEVGEPLGYLSHYCSSDRFAFSSVHLGELNTVQGAPISHDQVCSAPECFGWELESTSSGPILNYYRTKAFASDQEWATASLQARQDSLDHYLRDLRLQERPIGRRLASAPQFLSTEIWQDEPGIWEIVGTPQPSMEQMLAQMASVKELFAARWSTHLHISFPLASANQVDANRIQHLMYLLNEYSALRVFAHDAPAILYETTGPATWEETERVSEAIDAAYQHDTVLEKFKYYFVGFRCSEPYGPGRCGFEVRRAVNGVTEQLALLRALQTFWKDPRTIQLSNPIPLFVSEPSAPDQMLSEQLRGNFHTQEPLLALILQLTDQPELRIGEFLRFSALLPMVRWEGRIEDWRQQERIDAATAAELIARVTSERDTFLSALRSIAAELKPNDNLRAPITVTKETLYEIAIAVHQWARAVQLWKYY